MKRLLSVLALFMFTTPAWAVVAPIKVCDGITLSASTTTDCTPIEVPSSRYFSYQVYCGETTGNTMSVNVDWVGGSSTSALAVPSGVSQLKTTYTTEDAWSATATIDTPIVPYGTIRFTESNGDADIVCSAILNVNATPNLSTEDPVLTGTTSLLGGAVVGETLGSEILTQTCAGWGMNAGNSYTIGTWVCDPVTNIATRTANAGNLTISNSAVVTGVTYKLSTTATITASGYYFGAAGVYITGTNAMVVSGVTNTGHIVAGLTSAVNITAGASFAGTIPLGSVSVRAVTSTISPASGPLVLTKTMADATANEAAVSIIGKQTGAGGNKTALRVETIGSGTGSEFIQEWYADGVRKANVDNAGGLTAPQLNIDVINVNTAWPIYINNSNVSVANTTGVVVSSGSWTATSGAAVTAKVAPTYNQASGTAANTDLLISRTETALGSGPQKMLSLQAGAAGTTEYFGVTNRGIVLHNNGSTVVAAATIAPTGAQFHVSGTTQIATITAPQECASGCEIMVIPDGLFTTSTGGNIALATTAVLNRVIKFVYDATTVKWYPSY